MSSDRDALTLKLKLVDLSEVEDIEEELKTKSVNTSSENKVGISARVVLNDSEADSESEIEADSGVEADTETESDSGEESESEGENDSEEETDSEEEPMVSRANTELWNEYVSRVMLTMQEEPSKFDQSKLSGFKKMFIKNPDVAGRVYLAGKDCYRDDDGQSWDSGDVSEEDHSRKPEYTSSDHYPKYKPYSINSETYFYPTSFEYEVPDRYKEKWFTNPLYRKRVHRRLEGRSCQVCGLMSCMEFNDDDLDERVFATFKDRKNEGKDDYLYVSKRNQFKL